MHFLGMTGYYRKLCRNLHCSCSPHQLTKETRTFIWTSACQEAFDRVKAILLSSPVLIAPDFDKQFKLYMDVSDVDDGAMLQQEDDRTSALTIQSVIFQGSLRTPKGG